MTRCEFFFENIARHEPHFLGMADFRREYLARLGLSVNENGGTYRSGYRHPIDKRLEIANEYLRQKEANNGLRPNIANVARACRVSHSTASRVSKLVDAKGMEGLVEYEENCAERVPQGREGVLSGIDKIVLIVLLEIEPSRTLESYRTELALATGTLVSKSTISRCLRNDFPFKGNLRCPNHVPIDKFRPENLEQALKFIEFVAVADIRRLKFGDEKHLKGSEVYNKKVRVNPLTGQVPATVTNSDFRNAYHITALCGIDRDAVSPLYYRIHDGSNDSFEFAADLETAARLGFLRPGDFLILDNASIHSQGDNDDLDDYMWETYGVFIVFLPTRTPEWNPTELVWRMLVQRLRYYPRDMMQRQHASYHAAVDILRRMTLTDIESCYHQCGYL